MNTHYLNLLMSNVSFVLFLAATILALLNKLVKWRVSMAEIVYRWYALLALGATSLYTAYMHVIDPVQTAALLGWANSPFQYEVAMACLGFGVIAVLSFKASYGFRIATVLANTCWLWGDATVHVHQMMTTHTFNLISASGWFWLDIFVPVILLLCLMGIKKREQQVF